MADLFAVFGIVILALFLFMFFPDIFPRCSICRKKKFRLFIRIHEPRGLLPSYRKNRSACRKCCKKYGIDSLREYEQLYRIKKRLEVETYLYSTYKKAENDMYNPVENEQANQSKRNRLIGPSG